jgi:hypothetical protein
MPKRAPPPIEVRTQRIGCPILIWTAAVIALAVVAVFLRILMNAAG